MEKVSSHRPKQRLLPVCPGVLAQQGQPVEQVARLNQQRHQKRLRRRKGESSIDTVTYSSEPPKIVIAMHIG